MSDKPPPSCPCGRPVYLAGKGYNFFYFCSRCDELPDFCTCKPAVKRPVP
jgi:hypothetical protein